MMKGALTFRHPEYYLFFTETRNGRRAAGQFLARLKERTENRDKPVSIAAFIAQLKAERLWVAVKNNFAGFTLQREIPPVP